MKRTLMLGLLLGAFFCGSPVLAVDLVGEWGNIVSEDHHGALSGAPDHELRPVGNHFVTRDLLWTLKITSREGNGFHGQWCSLKKCEQLVGVVRKDGSMLMVDEDSTFFATMYGDEMELCVTEPGEAFRLAACLIMKKK